jgi:hypothetical protein
VNGDVLVQSRCGCVIFPDERTELFERCDTALSLWKDGEEPPMVWLPPERCPLHGWTLPNAFMRCGVGFLYLPAWLAVG